MATTFFKKTNKRWNIGIKGIFELTLEPAQYDDIGDNILTALLFLEVVLQKENNKVIIFIDEFQEISQLEEAYEIKGAIRHFAQKTKHVTFIFSGSNRRLLSKIFNERSEPLYQLCDTIQLKKIASKTVQQKLDLSSTAIYKAVEWLETADLITKLDDSSFSIIDPIIKSILRDYEVGIID